MKDSVAVKKLMEYCNCHNIKINTIEKLITDIVTNIGLDTSLCSSQAYNGTGNMSGEQKCATNQLCEITAKKKNSLFYCESHELKLCLSKASNVPDVHNMVSTMKSLGSFSNFWRKCECQVVFCNYEKLFKSQL